MRLLIILTSLFLTIAVESQVTTYNLPPKPYYKNANITTKDFRKYECRKVHFELDSVSFINSNSKLQEMLAYSDIDYIRIKEGNQAFTWGGYGALFMGLMSVLNVLEYPNPQNSGVVIVSFTVSGAVLGGLIGLTIPRWKTYYLDN